MLVSIYHDNELYRRHFLSKINNHVTIVYYSIEPNLRVHSTNRKITVAY